MALPKEIQVKEAMALLCAQIKVTKKNFLQVTE
jgi:hypothetical protein